jgi:3-oxoacyl-(acyl-carrier-protein) synthase
MTVVMIARAWRTPLGDTIDAAMARVRAGERAASFAPIPHEPARSRHGRFLRRIGMFGLEAATEALAASGLAGGARVGLFSGVGGLRAHWDDMLAAFEHQRDDGERMWERGIKDVHPFWMLRHLSNNVHALASAELGLRGEGATFGGGNGGAQALAAATRALREGAVEAALVVAYDSLLEPETLVELDARGTAPTVVPGEAAAAVVLVREGDGARISVCESAGAGALARCAARVTGRDALLDGTQTISAAMGELGAATAVVQIIALADMLRAEPAARGALGVHASPPHLASAVRVEVTP